jgi:hypothetical protein
MPLPGFVLDATGLLASESYRAMDITQRGVWISVLMHCWANESVPRDPKELAEAIGVRREWKIVQRVLEGPLARLLHPDPADSARLLCKEIEDVRSSLQRKLKIASDSGKLGASRRYGKNKPGTAVQQGAPHQGSSRGTPNGEPSTSTPDRVGGMQSLGAVLRRTVRRNE